MTQYLQNTITKLTMSPSGLDILIPTLISKILDFQQLGLYHQA